MRLLEFKIGFSVKGGGELIKHLEQRQAAAGADIVGSGYAGFECGFVCPGGIINEEIVAPLPNSVIG